MDSLRKNKTWELVDPPAGQKLVSSKWLYKIKEGIKGVQKPRYKARLVARGFTQRAGIDYSKVFSPVVRHTSIRVILALTACKDYELEQLDVKTTFLHGNLEEVIYMRQPPGYEHGNKVCLLKKSLYGLKQSPRQWSYAPGEYIYLLLYVDDMLIACKSKAKIGSTKSLLKKEFDMKELGEAKKILGMEIVRDRSRKILRVSQSGYISKILNNFRIDNGKSVQMPLGGHFKLSLKDCPVRDCDVERMSKVPYANAVGSLMYLMVCTRPDIAYAVSVVSRYLANPDRGNHVDVTGFVDSDYAKDPDKGRSITGYAFLVQGCVVSWKATLQHVVALSTTEAEYMALTEAVKEAIWLRGLLEELGVVLNTVAVNCDNQGAIHLSRNHVFHERTKHINVRYHFIREVLEAKTVKVLKVAIHGPSVQVRSPTPCSPWYSIVREIQNLKNKGVDLLSHCKKRVGNGMHTKFWHDIWIGDQKLCCVFPRLFALEEDKDCYVASKFHGSVDLSFRRAARGGVEAQQFAQLRDMLDTVILSNLEDRWRWDLNGSGSFRVCDVRNLLDEFFLPKDERVTRWVKCIPIKINVFAWRVSLDRLPTRLNLIRRGVQVPSTACPICTSDPEDISHLLFRCLMASDIHRLICCWWGLPWSPLSSYAEWLSWFKDIRLGSKVKSILEGVCYVSWWCLWIYRNQLLFATVKPRKDLGGVEGTEEYLEGVEGPVDGAPGELIKSRSRIKAHHYANHTSPDEAKNHPPPPKVWGERTQDDWNALVDWWSQPDRVSRSLQNAANLAKNTIITHQGKKSFAQGRNEYSTKGIMRASLKRGGRGTQIGRLANLKPKNEQRYLDMKAMKDNIKAGLIPFKTDQEILDEIVPSDNRQNMSGMGRKLPGGGSTSRRRANRAFGDIMTRDQITQMFRQQEQEKELHRKQAEEAQARAYLASLKADAADQRANVAQQNSEANNAALAERPRYILQTNPHMNDLRNCEQLAQDLARENNNESSSREEEEGEQQSGGDDDYSDEDE
ncbi:retrotransposon protein, putative, ty1-copia subclass [Tanacetum coccineum]|uniref:Retrotransposon protein, putative, ty1-copia subclass n=1 Tax=Tanacetum coccineum TaxID=301880 RepID=A0ABQ5IZM9_9ASTR